MCARRRLHVLTPALTVSWFGNLEGELLLSPNMEFLVTRPLHDPTVIAYLIQKDLFKGKHVNVEVEINSELTMGMSVVDWWEVSDRIPNVTYINQIDADGFFQLIIERLSRL